MTNPYVLRGSLYWDEFWPILKEAAVYPDTFRIFGPMRYTPDIVSIYDYTWPQRNILLHTGYAEDDINRDAKLTNAAWYGGEIPLKQVMGPLDRPAPGVKLTLLRLLDKKAIIRTEDVELLLEACE